MANATTTKPAANGARAAAQAPQQPVNRMTLDTIKTGPESQPDRILIVGTEGVGKTTFAAEAESTVFICAEDGIPKSLRHIKRFPEPKTFNDVIDAIRTLINEDHSFKTLAIDTLDWLEPIIWRDLCAKNSWENIESPGYGKGYVTAGDEWRRLLAALDVLRKRKGTEIILLAHASIKTFQNPAGDDYSRYECKLHKIAAALVKEWTDTNLFAIHEEFAKTDTRGKVTKKGHSTGRRVIHTERTAAWDAKNRWNLPPELALNYADYAEARLKGEAADPEELRSEGDELIDSMQIEDPKKDELRAWFEKAKAADVPSLVRAVDRLRTKAAELGGES